MNLQLVRAPGFVDCTRGSLTLPDGQILYTLELPWIPDPSRIGGVHSKSCVPMGLYDLELHDTAKHPETFALVNPALGVIHEPDAAYPDARVACLIHVANYVQDLEGCIGVGMSASTCMISASKVAFGKFNAQIPWVTGHTLDIA